MIIEILIYMVYLLIYNIIGFYYYNINIYDIDHYININIL